MMPHRYVPIFDKEGLQNDCQPCQLSDSETEVRLSIFNRSFPWIRWLIDAVMVMTIVALLYHVSALQNTAHYCPGETSPSKVPKCKLTVGFAFKSDWASCSQYSNFYIWKRWGVCERSDVYQSHTHVSHATQLGPHLTKSVEKHPKLFRNISHSFLYRGERLCKHSCERLRPVQPLRTI